MSVNRSGSAGKILADQKAARAADQKRYSDNAFHGKLRS